MQAQAALSTGGAGVTSISYPAATTPASAAAGLRARSGGNTRLAAAAQHVPRGLNASSSTSSSSGPAPAGWLAGSTGGVPLQRRQQRLGRGCRPSQLPPQAAELAGELPADDAGAAEQAAGSAPWWQALTSPYDKEIVALALPALVSVLLDPMMGAIDTGIVGRLGTAPLAAVGLCTMIYNFSNFVWNFLLYTTTPRVAAAASRGDKKGVAAVASQGLWLGALIGSCMTLLLWIFCPQIFAFMGAPEGVTQYAVPYLRARCLASPAIMMYYVLSGTFRGFKDTMTPLAAGVWSNAVHLALALSLAPRFGVVGVALATSVSHWLTLAILMRQLLAKGYASPAELLRPPSLRDIAPMLQNGLLLSTRSLLAMSILMWSTKLIAGLGAVSLAAHEILRQIWVLSNQSFTALDIATQSLVAFHLGRGDRRAAAAIFNRTLTLALCAGVVILGLLLLNAAGLPSAFSKDPAVIRQVVQVLPLIAVFMPLDAAASVMDGVLLGAQEARWMSGTMVVTALVAGGLLVASQSLGWPVLAVWAIIKVLTVGRLTGNTWRLWSKQGPLAVPAAAA